jgi:isoleucyl-tRNA synthetase
LAAILASELNVKEVLFADSSDALVTLTAKANFRTLGKKFGKQMKAAADAVFALTSDQLLQIERGEAFTLTAGGESQPIVLEDVLIERHAAGALIVAQDGARFAAVDPTITPALRAEGVARELVSRVQRMRKDRGFAVSDRITVQVQGEEQVQSAIRAHHAWIVGEVLATQLVVGDGAEAPDAVAADLDGLPVRITLTKVTAA